MEPTEFSAAGLDQVKVGDYVAPIRIFHVLGKPTTKWTGALMRVTKVGEKRFCVGTDRWVAKDTGLAVTREGGRYVLATEAMLAEVARRNQAQEEATRKAAAFQARMDYRYATSIRLILEEMTPDNHPLDRLTIEQWAALYNALMLTHQSREKK